MLKEMKAEGGIGVYMWEERPGCGRWRGPGGLRRSRLLARSDGENGCWACEAGDGDDGGAGGRKFGGIRD